MRQEEVRNGVTNDKQEVLNQSVERVMGTRRGLNQAK